MHPIRRGGTGCDTRCGLMYSVGALGAEPGLILRGGGGGGWPSWVRAGGVACGSSSVGVRRLTDGAVPGVSGALGLQDGKYGSDRSGGSRVAVNRRVHLACLKRYSVHSLYNAHEPRPRPPRYKDPFVLKWRGKREEQRLVNENLSLELAFHSVEDAHHRIAEAKEMNHCGL